MVTQSHSMEPPRKRKAKSDDSFRYTPNTRLKTTTNIPSATTTTPTKTRKSSAQSLGDIALNYTSLAPLSSAQTNVTGIGDTRTASRSDATQGRSDLAKELHGHVYVNVDGVYDVYLGIPPASNQHSQPSTPTTWTTPPGLGDKTFVTWLVTMLNTFQQQATDTTPPLGKWRDTRDERISSGYSTRRGPDFCLVPPTHAAEEELHWGDFLVVGEHQSKSKSTAQIVLQLADYAEQVITHQPLRTHVHALLTTLDGNGGVRLFVFDRSGAIASTLAAVSCETLGMLARGYGCITRERLGLPLEDEGRGSVPLPDGRRAVLGATLCRRPGIIGRGTYCALADVAPDVQAAEGLETPPQAPPHPRLLVKFSWRSEVRPNEGALLQLAAERGVVGIPQHVAHADLTDVHSLRGNLGQTGTHLPLLAPFPHNKNSNNATTVDIAAENRIYTRIIMKTVGQPISTCTTPLTILHALLGALIGHASLFFTGRLLHRDISTSNILYSPDAIAIPASSLTKKYLPESLQGLQGFTLQGFLIDLDYAVEYPRETRSGAPHKTGTLPFISIGVLEGEDHSYGHDLESFLYVLLWLCVGGDMKEDQPLLEEWQDGSIKRMICMKVARMVDSTLFEELLRNEFLPEFGGGEGLHGTLKDVARGWRKVLFGVEGAAVLVDHEMYQIPLNSRSNGFVKDNLTEWDAFVRMRDILWESVQKE